jgi:hypothetical protein
MNMMIDMAENSRDGIARELHAWHTTGLRIAIWGNGGELAAFLGAHGLDAGQFLVVVYSDPARAGTLVPGTSQTIRSPDWLRDHPVDIILIPCPWRAADIVRQIDAARITYEGILIPHQDHLVDYHAAEMILA